MAQFEVYLNPSNATRAHYPYLVDIQSDHLAALTSRLVIPLCRARELEFTELQDLAPGIEYQDEALILLTPKLAAMPARLLSEPVGSVAHLRSVINAAIDFAVTGY